MEKVFVITAKLVKSIFIVNVVKVREPVFIEVKVGEPVKSVFF